MTGVEKYPLQWPQGYPRKKYPEKARFGNQSFASVRDELFHELDLLLDYWERKTVVLSTNIPLRLDGIPYAGYRQPDDKGVAVYFQYKKESVVLCCDEWNKIEHNILSVAKTVNALRGIERWGVSDFLKHAFTGFTALPPPTPEPKKRQWWVVLNYQQKPGTAAWDWNGIEAQYKSLAKKLHPDVGGTVSAFQELAEAYSEAKREFKRA